MHLREWIPMHHLDRLTDSTGLVQHAIYGVPRRASGYTTDDNARALLGVGAVAAVQGQPRWNEAIARCIIANFRTTGAAGFRAEVMRLADKQELWQAFLLARKVDAVLPGDPLLAKLWPQFAAEIVWQALLFSLIMGFVGGVLPALRASRMKIVDALRTT